jgi:predicted nucleic acid-binding protein
LSYLFDTNAISEPLRKKPNPTYVEWLLTLAPEHQFTSIVVVAELFAGAFHSPAVEKWLDRIENDILPRLIVLGFDLHCAREYGRLKANLQQAGKVIGDLDLQIAATAVRHRLVLVTANEEHFRRIPDLQLRTFYPGVQPS